MAETTINDLETEIMVLKQQFIAYKAQMEGTVQQLDRRVALIEQRLIKR